MAIDITKTDTTLTIKVDEMTYSFPSSKVILVQEKDSDSVSVKLLGSRKTILTLPNKDLEDFE